MEGKSTTDAIQCLRKLMEKHRDARKDLFLVFINLEKAFDRVPRELIWLALRAHDIPGVYVSMIMDIRVGRFLRFREIQKRWVKNICRGTP